MDPAPTVPPLDQPRQDLTPSGGPADGGLLTAAQASLLVDQYELAMASSYLEHDLNEPAVFELFARAAPPGWGWLLVAGLQPALALVRGLRFGEGELAYLESLGLGSRLLGLLARFRFSGDVDAMPEGTVAFPGEPLVRVSAPRVQAQLLETLLLNQVDFQTAIATRAARLALAAGAGAPAGAERIADFAARRHHGVDAAVKGARAAAVAGVTSTSNVAAARRYGLRPVGTMAHSYVLSFADEPSAFTAFLKDMPESAVLLVDTYDTPAGVRNAIAAARSTGVALAGVRIDSGDLAALSRDARAMLDAAGMERTEIMASGDLDERRIAALVRARAPIDRFGVGTALAAAGADRPLGCVYKLVADAEPGGGWRGVAKRSPAKATIAGPKQVYRSFAGHAMSGDLVAHIDERQAGRPLLERFVASGQTVREDALPAIGARAQDGLASLPAELRRISPAESAPPAAAYPVSFSARLVPAG